MQNSLQRLFEGMAEALRDVVMPEVADDYARAQIAACIELLANVSTRVEWRVDQVREVTERADAAVGAAVALTPDMANAPGMEAVGGSDAVVARDRALARVSAALRWCDDHPSRDDGAEPLVGFARWHLRHELALLRTGMFRG